MFCQNCGNRLPDNAAFCSKCGSKVNQEESVKQEKISDSAAQEEKPKQTIVLVLLTGIFVIIVGIVGGIFLFGKKTEDEVLLADGTVMEDEDWQELKPLYDAVDVPVIDIRAVNYTPGTKVPGILWDKTLFYWLEDVDQTSSEDGYLAKCPVSRMLLRSTEDGNLIEYEIYRNPETEEIYKIVSIEQGSQELHLTDYYYQDGNPNFTFSRNDSVYTPTYATTAKRGERYYFNGDVLARWRMIEEPYAIEEYVLTLNDAAYSQYDYFEESVENQKSYDETEIRELNAARNTFDAVTNAGTGVGLVEGYVSDAAGNPLSGMTVDILRENDDVLLYRSVTAEDGSFNIFVYLEDISCRVVVRGNDIYASNSIRGMELSGVTGGNNCGELRLHRLGEDEYPVDINVYDAADVRTGEDGSMVKDLLAGTKVFLREGAGVRTGETVRVLDADVNGAVQTTLPAGTYTAQIDVPGYVSAYATVEVAEKETTAEIYMLPVPEAGQTGIVLSWEGEADLDLTLFTPYQSTDGDMAHIGGKSMEDGHGNRLVADNAAGCEVMYVNTGEAGNYKLYVNNYTESEAGNYGSGQFSALNVHVCIYDSTGLIGEFSFPIGQKGVVWEVADINRNRITPAQRVYSSLEGKRWWTESKWTLDMEENIHLKHLMESMVLAAWGNNDYEGYGYSSNTVSSMQAWADELYRGNWENMGDWLGTVALCYYAYPKDYDREDMSYIEEIMTQPDVVKILQEPDSYGNSREGWLLTKEQLAYLAYAASGIDWNIQSVNDVMNAHPCTEAGEVFIEQIDDRILFRNGEAGMELWFNLKNIVSEYTGAGKWSVSADCIYVNHEISLQMADVIFTVTRNPDSCFDGYSITGMNITPTDNLDWAQAYYDYLHSNAEALNNSYGSYGLIYVDNDNIPEMVLYGLGEASGNIIINYSGGTAHETQLTRSYFSYIERANLLCNSWGHMDGYGDIVYSIIDGKMTVIAEGRYGAEDNTNVQYDINGNPIYVFEWKGRTVTEAEYDAELRKVYDYDKATEKSSYDYDTYTYDDIVNIIMYLIDN